MERYENIVKIEEIRRLMEQNQYVKAAKVLDTMDISRIKTLTDLSIIADVYSQNERYGEAVEVLLKIYSKTKTRRVLYQLVETSIKRRNAREAEEYLEKYIKIAPQDSYRFVFRYCIDKLNKEPYEILISSLEKLKEHEYIEMWAYELAKLYHKAGLKDKCVRECSDIILWFGDGIYVEKARLLKAYYVGEINPVHMLKAKEKKEAEMRLGLDKTKDYSSIRSQIDQFLAREETAAAATAILKQEETYTEADVQEWKGEYTGEEWQLLTDVWSSGEQQVQWTEDERTEESLVSESKEELRVQSEEDSYYQPEENTVIPQEESNAQVYSQYEEATDDIKAENQEVQVEDTSIQPEEEPFNDLNPMTGVKNPEDNNTQNYEQTKKEWIDAQSEVVYPAAKNTIYSVFSEAGYETEKELGYFYRWDYTREQIKNCLETILSDYTTINHMFITGGEKTGKTTLAKKICKGLHCLNWIKSNKIAIISGDRFNALDILSKKNKLYNGSLVIEEAGSLDSTGKKKLLDLLSEMKENILVILEDKEEAFQSFLNGDKHLAEYFKNSIHLPEYSDRDLTGFAVAYINGKDYLFTESVEEAFFEKVKLRMADLKPEERLGAVIEFAKEIIQSADNRYRQMLSEILGNRSLDSEDLLYIIEEDFAGR
ncbi:hypothetical protein acsn021_44290 [Anaerocolumna cellulosilytica]|uniref:Uncharacterized protein n=1 Tax=Anaerocolumna cellulosilytica TaxID=433286 RepID=A0A6S6RBH6_9FIRM|nr:hypothetical protein [Anaerocolumna cellulosilytica]MBB5195850.1 hypothetical protein [Anaerocolumna cellulosilytica]BCJ96860.1 hypothetical protein acsn021_44290 [Anaerocolumna cellulosilytica]